MARPSLYTEEIIREICDRLSTGEPLAQICRDEGMPAVRTVGDWSKERADVSASIARAREEGEESIALDCLHIADDNGKDTRVLKDGVEVVDSDWIQRSKLRIDTRLKLLAKWNPKKWGEKIDMTSDNKPISVTINAPGGGSKS